MHKIKTNPIFRAALQGNTLEMLLYTDIGQSFDGSGVTAQSIKEQIDAAGNYDRIALRINSPGGDAFEGMAIHNLLRAQGKPVDVWIDGVAASIAALVAMAGDSINMFSNCLMMIHPPWSLTVGTAADHRDMADTLDKVGMAIAQTYAKRTGNSVDKVKQMMDSETWLSAEECLAYGFATQVNELAAAPSALALAKSFKAFAKFKAVPESLKAGFIDPECSCACSSCMEGDCSDCTNDVCDNANCLDCPQQMQNSNLSLYQARLRLLTLSSCAC